MQTLSLFTNKSFLLFVLGGSGGRTQRASLLVLYCVFEWLSQKGETVSHSSEPRSPLSDLPIVPGRALSERIHKPSGTATLMKREGPNMKCRRAVQMGFRKNPLKSAAYLPPPPPPKIPPSHALYKFSPPSATCEIEFLGAKLQSSPPTSFLFPPSTARKFDAIWGRAERWGEGRFSPNTPKTAITLGIRFLPPLPPPFIASY